MSSLPLYREQAAQQQAAADAATLENVRDRRQRASNAWTALAVRSERADRARLQAATDKLLNGMSENPDLGAAGAPFQRRDV